MGRVLVFTLPTCTHCRAAKATLARRGVPYVEVSLSAHPTRRGDMESLSNRATVPQIFLNDHHVGGASDLQTLIDADPDAFDARARRARRPDPPTRDSRPPLRTTPTTNERVVRSPRRATTEPRASRRILAPDPHPRRRAHRPRRRRRPPPRDPAPGGPSLNLTVFRRCVPGSVPSTRCCPDSAPARSRPEKTPSTRFVGSNARRVVSRARRTPVRRRPRSVLQTGAGSKSVDGERISADARPLRRARRRRATRRRAWRIPSSHRANPQPTRGRDDRSSGVRGGGVGSRVAHFSRQPRAFEEDATTDGRRFEGASRRSSTSTTSAWRRPARRWARLLVFRTFKYSMTFDGSSADASTPSTTSNTVCFEAIDRTRTDSFRNSPVATILARLTACPPPRWTVACTSPSTAARRVARPWTSTPSGLDANSSRRRAFHESSTAVDVHRGVARVSSLYRWYRRDFGANDVAVATRIMGWLAGERRKALEGLLANGAARFRGLGTSRRLDGRRHARLADVHGEGRQSNVGRITGR